MKPHPKKIRIIVRPWTPRFIPFEIPSDAVNIIMRDAYPQLKKIVYVGWIRRVQGDKNVLLYLAATGDTAKEARHAFKHSTEFGLNVWNLHA